jgi:hypothetical protein
MTFLCLYNLYKVQTVHRVSSFLASDMVVRYCPSHIFGVSDVWSPNVYKNGRMAGPSVDAAWKTSFKLIYVNYVLHGRSF